jgi:hypothetical protein
MGYSWSSNGWGAEQMQDKADQRAKKGGASELETSALVVYTRAKVRGKVVVVEGTTSAAPARRSRPFRPALNSSDLPVQTTHKVNALGKHWLHL